MDRLAELTGWPSTATTLTRGAVAVGSSLVVSGSLSLDADGSPAMLTAGGATAHAFRTMAGYERGAGTVWLTIEWE